MVGTCRTDRRLRLDAVDGSAGGCPPPPGEDAAELDRVLFTQDDDLLVEATYRQRRGQSFQGVIYAHQLRISIGGCIRDLELVARAGEAEDMAEQVLFLPL